MHKFDHAVSLNRYIVYERETAVTLRGMWGDSVKRDILSGETLVDVHVDLRRRLVRFQVVHVL